MTKPKVFLTGGDNIGWALDDDLSLTKQVLEGIVDFTRLEDSDVVHSVWWEGLLQISGKLLDGKRIVCHVPNRPFHYMSQPRHRLAMNIVGRWVVRAEEARREMQSVGIDCALIPYVINTDIFTKLPKESPELSAMRERWKIPEDRYLIGNFHRDSEGSDLRKPKVQKGVDIFFEIVNGLSLRGLPVHVLLAGPRRHWLRGRLKDAGVPFTHIGEIVETDDIKINILSRPTLNLLYNLLDLYLISSRWEGGPQSVMEAAASQCKVISTKVGLAEDILDPKCIFSSPVDAIDIIERDIRHDLLKDTIEHQFKRMQESHTPERLRSEMQAFYQDIKNVPVYKSPAAKTKDVQSIVSLLTSSINNVLTGGRKTVCLWHKFFKPPYGGGNQFMMALEKAFKKRRVRVITNKISNRVDAYLLNSVHFDVDKFRKLFKEKQCKIIHRVDGPIYLYRGNNQDLDRLCFELNSELAYATVIQSEWTYQRIVEMGYKPKNPVIIHNAADPDIFHRRGRISFDRGRKIRLISTSWSDNPRKGASIYKWIEENLDWERFEYTFVGRSQEKFHKIKCIDALPSEQLAAILRQNDIYVTASQNDPCSNALIEALSCGLPALYLNSGGHPELVGYGGLPFNNEDEILPQLDRLVENYEMFQNLIVVQSIEDVADRYLLLLKG